MTAPVGSFDLAPYQWSLVTAGQVTGYFDRVNAWEPKSKPGDGVTGAVFLNGIRPALHGSGLASTSIVLDWMFRVYCTMQFQDPERADQVMGLAGCAVFFQLIDDFTVSGSARAIDVRGIEGQPLAARPGYIRIDERVYRAMDISVPMIINDVFPEQP